MKPKFLFVSHFDHKRRSSSASLKVNHFEQVLARTNDLELSLRESGLSSRLLLDAPPRLFDFPCWRTAELVNHGSAFLKYILGGPMTSRSLGSLTAARSTKDPSTVFFDWDLNKDTL
jgi:hypothetical protein